MFDRNESVPVQSEFTWYVPVRVRRMICPPKLLTSDPVNFPAPSKLIRVTDAIDPPASDAPLNLIPKSPRIVRSLQGLPRNDPSLLFSECWAPARRAKIRTKPKAAAVVAITVIREK